MDGRPQRLNTHQGIAIAEHRQRQNVRAGIAQSKRRADRIADKLVLFTLPAAGAIVWLTNAILGSLIYRREKVAAYLLWGSSIAMQLCLWVAVLTITA